MTDKKFDPKKLQKLNNPDRLKDIPPEFIHERLGGGARETLVEIGAGTAFFSIALYNYFRPQALYACDISELMIDWMSANVVPKYPAIVPVKTAESSVPLADEIADLVFMINLHHELDNPAESIAESYRLSKSGGNILIIDWKKEEMKDGPPQHIRCETETIVKQLEMGGFAHIEVFDTLPKHFMLIGKKS